MKKVIGICFFAIICGLIQPNLIYPMTFRDFDVFQHAVTRQEAEHKIKHYILHDSANEDFYAITDDALFSFSSAENKKINKPEYVLHFGISPKPSTNVFKPNSYSDKPFHGLRVAIDPGHLGGRMAQIEERFIDMKLPDEQQTRIQFDEGALATVTAMVLKHFLTQVGADVFLTRDEAGKSVFKQSFEEWCADVFGVTDDTQWLTEENRKKVFLHLANAQASVAASENLARRLKLMAQASLEDKVQLIKKTLFRVCYNSLDLKARSEKINEFNPHLTIIIHFNANGGSEDISMMDYNLAFIPGSFLKGELSGQAARYEFVRLIVSNDVEESLRLSQAIVKNLETGLKVPLMNSDFYLSDAVKFAQDGIYCRNLALTRLVHSPLCYGETLIQNNPDEAKRLALKDFNFNGVIISSRIYEVASAYFKGISQYFGL